MAKSISALVLAVALTAAAPVRAQTPLDAFTEFTALCLEWDGDLVAAEELAKERGYRPAQDRVARLGSRERRQWTTFAWVKTEGDLEVQLVLRPQSFIGNATGSERSYHDKCSIAVRPGERGRLRDQLARKLGQDSFRQMGASVFAWTIGAQGRAPVRRNVFENRLMTLFDDRGMRMVTVAEHHGQVILSLFVPARMDCRLREDYSETEPNIVCGAS
jgi:hypothetical protein